MNTIILASEKIQEDVPINIADFFFREKFIYLDGDINDDSAADAAAMLLCLDKQNPQVPIQMIINSFAGDNRSILMLYDVMRSLKTPVYTLCVGECMGGALLLLAAGSKRSCTENASFQLSQLNHDYIVYSNILDAKTLQENFKKDNTAFIQAMSHLSSKRVSEILKKKDKYFFDAQEALKLKIVDEIMVPPKKEAPAKPKKEKANAKKVTASKPVSKSNGKTTRSKTKPKAVPTPAKKSKNGK